MAIFGTGRPKIITSADVSINLDYGKVLKDEPDFSLNIRHQNPISGDRVYVSRCYHWIYEIQLYLYKFAAPDVTYDLLNTALYDTVTLYRHRDSDPFKDESGTVCPFKFTELIPFYVETVEYRDALICKFESTKLIDLAFSSFGTLSTEEDITITTETDEDLRTR